MLRLTLFAACLLLSFSAYAFETNNGEDITRPVTRFDIRTKGQTGASSQKGNTLILTFRTDMAITLPAKWQIGLRADAPFEAFFCPCKSTPDCYTSRRMGDSLFQAFIITPDFKKWAFAIGTKVIFPTAGKNLEIGDGKYQFLPSCAFRFDLSEWNKGGYCGAIFREALGYIGYSSAPKIIQTYIQPFFNINLPRQFFLNSSPEIFYDWGSHHWFIPFDLMIGKMITKSCVISLEYETAIVDKYPNYQQQLEFRVGIFF